MIGYGPKPAYVLQTYTITDDPATLS
jgi:hypothetical protein